MPESRANKLSETEITSINAAKSSEFFPIPLDTVPLDSELTFPLYVKIGGQHIFFRTIGDILSNQRATSLTAKGVDTLYTTEEFWAAYLAWMENTIDPAKGNNSGKAITCLRNVLLVYTEHLQEKRELQRVTFEKIKNFTFSLAIGIKENPAYGLTLLRRFNDNSLFLANHGINVAVYSAYIGNKLNFSTEDLKHLTLGALVHDIGNLLLPKDLLTNLNPTKEEWDLIRSHAKKGADYLSSLFPIKEVALIALQHHERMDGKGYPQGLKDDQIHLFTRIVSMANVFEKLTNSRPCHPEPFGAEAAVRMMYYMEGKFDTKLFRLVEE